MLPARSVPVVSVRTPSPVRHAALCAALLPTEVLPLTEPELLPEFPPPQPVNVSAAASVQHKNQRDACFISSHTLPFRACIADAGFGASVPRRAGFMSRCLHQRA